MVVFILFYFCFPEDYLAMEDHDCGKAVCQLARAVEALVAELRLQRNAASASAAASAAVEPAQTQKRVVKKKKKDPLEGLHPWEKWSWEG